MIEVRKLSYRYPGEVEPALDGVSLEVRRGELLLLLGRNGSGKSTFAKHLNGLLLPQSGEVWVDGLSTRGAELWRIRRLVGLLFQNPVDRIVGNTLVEEVAFGPENLGLSAREIARRVEEALRAVGLAKGRTRSPDQLSQGELQRLALAGVLAMEPEYLVLDEPFAQIDIQSQLRLVQLLKGLKAQGRGMVLISQEPSLIEHAEQVAFLSQGKLLGKGRPEDLSQDGRIFTAAGLQPPQIIQLYQWLEGFPKLSPAPLTVEEFAEELRPRLRTDGPGDHRHVVGGGRGRGSPVLEAEDLTFFYNMGRADQLKALEEISLKIEGGSFVGITGASGAGKSTLVQQLAGLLRHHGGAVRFRGREVDGPLAGVGLVFQNPLQQLFAEDLQRELNYGLRERELPRGECERRTRAACGAVGLDYERHKLRSPFSLSGGDQVKLCIATALALDPEVLILDETLTALDLQIRREVIEHLRRLNQEGMTIVVVSHRLGDLLAELDQVFILEGGRLVASGKPGELLERLGSQLPPVARLTLQLGLPVAFTVEEALRTLQPILDSATV